MILTKFDLLPCRPWAIYVMKYNQMILLMNKNLK